MGSMRYYVLFSWIIIIWLYFYVVFCNYSLSLSELLHQLCSYNKHNSLLDYAAKDAVYQFIMLDKIKFLIRLLLAIVMDSIILTGKFFVILFAVFIIKILNLPKLQYCQQTFSVPLKYI